MFWRNYLVVLVCCLFQESRSRHVSLSMNLSLVFSDGHGQISSDVLQHCMRETEISMVQLNRFRESLTEPEMLDSGAEVDGVANGDGDTENTEDVDDGTGTGNDGISINDGTQYSSLVDYEGNVPPLSFSERNAESLQCFTYCLYDRLGLLKNDAHKEQELFQKLIKLIVERENKPIKECMHLESEKKCEAVYKMHVCYSKLKSIDAERRIREILEREDEKNEEIDRSEFDMNTTTDAADDWESSRANEIERE